MPVANDPRLTDVQVGDTPLLNLSFAFPELGQKVKVMAKAEWHNPGGSVKDRAGWFIFRDAILSGKLTKGKVLLPPWMKIPKCAGSWRQSLRLFLNPKRCS